MHTLGGNKGLSKTSAIIITVVVIVIIIGAVIAVSRRPTVSPTTPTVSPTTPTVSPTTPTVSPTTSTSSATSAVTLAPSNSSLLVDDTYNSIAGTVDELDPSVGFTLGDGPYFAAVFQELVEFNGSNYESVVPVIASSYSASNNYKTWTFDIRTGVTFSNGDPVNASTVWFSLQRVNLMGQTPGPADYTNLLYTANSTSSGYYLPWGVGDAIHAATGLPTNTNASLAAHTLANILSNFVPSNITIQKILSYPNQAIVVLNTTAIQINLVNSYTYFPLDLAGWWGAIVDPSFIDAHGGVQPNTANSYLDDNPEPATGPYMVKSYTPGQQLVLEANPNYWGKSLSNPAVVDEPAHIPVVTYNFASNHDTRVEAFVHNLAQISFVSISYLSSVESIYPSNYPSSSYIIDAGLFNGGDSFVSFNTRLFPTNITDFRLALVHSVNLTAIVKGPCEGLCTTYVGPIPPSYEPFYNPGNLSVYSYNLSLAMQLVNESGWQGDFNVVLPNGTVLGNPSGSRLSPIPIAIAAPVSPFYQAELEIIVNDWEQIGVSATVEPETVSVLLSQGTTVSGTPLALDSAWYPDWPDPVFQILALLTGPVGGVGLNYAWFNNSELLSIDATLPFVTNHTQYVQMLKQAYEIVYVNAPYLWLPLPETTYLVQPYVHGFVWNPLYGYYYNAMFY
jgi:peptide/nickel transport system substrate-binding protein